MKNKNERKFKGNGNGKTATVQLKADKTHGAAEVNGSAIELSPVRPPVETSETEHRVSEISTETKVPAIVAELRASPPEDTEAEEIIPLTKTEKKRSLTDEAFRWMKNPESIPGAQYPPFRFCGWDIIDALAKEKGSELGVDEVKCVVRKDGDLTTCAATLEKYQPCAFLPSPSVPEEIRKGFREGKKLNEITITTAFQGAFYTDRKNSQIYAISGPKYGPVGRHICNASNYVKMAKKKAFQQLPEAVRENTNYDTFAGKKWGMTKENQIRYLQDQAKKRKADREAEQRINRLVFD